MTPRINYLRVRNGCEFIECSSTYLVIDGSGNYKQSTFAPAGYAQFDSSMKYYVLSNQVFRFEPSNDSSVLLF